MKVVAEFPSGAFSVRPLAEQTSGARSSSLETGGLHECPLISPHLLALQDVPSIIATLRKETKELMRQADRIPDNQRTEYADRFYGEMQLCLISASKTSNGVLNPSLFLGLLLIRFT